MKAWLKIITVIVGAISVSALGIQASDTLRGIGTNLSGLAHESDGPCGEGATKLLFGDKALCVDLYEASAAAACPHSNISSQIDTQNNMNVAGCVPVTQPELLPWRYVSLTQAQQLCARVSKRLPTNEEWYKIASGLADQSDCVTSNVGGARPTGQTSCVTPAGVHDMVGNLWEWVDGEASKGIYYDRTLPDSGYVASVDSNGVVLETSPQAQEEFNEDYAWTKKDGVYGIIRGGFYGSETDAGIFAQNFATLINTKTAGIGFRCVRDI